MSDAVRVEIGDAALELVKGDITTEETDAIVNAANSGLLPGGGVCGAIHQAAGPQLAAECAALGGCATGDAKITKGYQLKARYVIHAVGPIYQGGTHDEAALLGAAYRRALEVAAENGLESIAFPSISTGIYGYPMGAAARVTLETIIAFLQTHALPKAVRVVLFDTRAFEIHKRVLEEQLTA